MGQALENVADMERLLGKISYNSLTARDCLALLRSLKAVAPVKAVSYTHLDVYKRQAQILALQLPRQRRQPD